MPYGWESGGWWLCAVPGPPTAQGNPGTLWLCVCTVTGNMGEKVRELETLVTALAFPRACSLGPEVLLLSFVFDPGPPWEKTHVSVFGYPGVGVQSHFSGL